MVNQVVRAIPFETEASENMGCDLRGRNFLLFSVCPAYVDVICSGSFCHFAKFYSLMFIHKISNRVVCENGKHRMF